MTDEASFSQDEQESLPLVDEDMQDSMVKVVNRVSGAKRQIKASEVSLFLKKHTLFEIVPQPPAGPARRARGVRGRGARGGASTPKPEKAEKSLLPKTLGKRTLAVKAEQSGGLPVQKPMEPLILTLAEAQEISRVYSSRYSTDLPITPADWTAISAQVCHAKFSAEEIRLVAEEYQPAVHYRATTGMVVIERTSAGAVDVKRRRMEAAAAKVEEARKSAIGGIQASDASKLRALGQPPHIASAPNLPGPSPATGPNPNGPTPPRGSAETEFVRDVLQAAQEWLQVIPTVATRDSMTALLIRASQATLGQ